MYSCRDIRDSLMRTTSDPTAKICIILQQPERLESLAMAELGKWATKQAENLIDKLRLIQCDADTSKYAIWRNQRKQNRRNEPELSRREENLVSRQKEKFQNYIINLDYDLHNKLLSELITGIARSEWKRRSNWMSQVYRSMIDAFFTSRLTVLKLDRHTHMTRCLHLLSSKSHMLALTHLELKLSLLPRGKGLSVEGEIIQILKHLHALKNLSITTYCTYDILQCIAENCPLVEELNISQSGARVNDDSARLLTQMQHLRRVHLSGTSVGPRGIEELLFGCEHLEHIDIRRDIMTQTLECMYAAKDKYLGKVFKLKACNSGASSKQLELLARICPHIQDMRVRKHATHGECNLPALAGFRHIRHLTLSGYYYYEDGVQQALRLCGANLTELHLDTVRQIDTDAVKHIGQTCPHLRTMTVISCAFLDRRPYSIMDAGGTAPFRRLQCLNWGIIKQRIELPALQFLLSNCMNVEYIDIKSRPDLLTEEFLLSVLDKNPLSRLEELIISLQTRHRCQQPHILTESVLEQIVRSGARPTLIHFMRSRLLSTGNRLDNYYYLRSLHS